MNKKFLIFGALAFFAIAVVTALVVPYLGSSISVEMGVNSPMVYTIDGTPGGTLNLGSIFGGESFEFTITAENLASVPTLVEAENILSNSAGLTCADILTASVHAISTEGWETTLILGDPSFECVIVDANNVRFFYGETTDLYGVGRLDTMDVSVTFAPNALGDYVFTATPLYPTA